MSSNFNEVPRNWDVWAPCLVPVGPIGTTALTFASRSLFRPVYEDLQDAPSPMTVDDEEDDTRERDMPGDQLDGTSTATDLPASSITILGLDLSAESLRAIPVPTSPEEAFAWTETQRSLAQLAETPETLEELQSLVRGCVSYGLARIKC